MVFVKLRRRNYSPAPACRADGFNVCATCFNGAVRYLEIAVRPAGNPDPYTILRRVKL